MVSRVRPPEIASFTLVRSLSIRSPARICVEISDRWQSCGWQSLTPSDVYFGRAQAILNKRERIKHKTFEIRRLQHREFAA